MITSLECPTLICLIIGISMLGGICKPLSEKVPLKDIQTYLNAAIKAIPIGLLAWVGLDMTRTPFPAQIAAVLLATIGQNGAIGLFQGYRLQKLGTKRTKDINNEIS